jgi:hypothetical protein
MPQRDGMIGAVLSDFVLVSAVALGLGALLATSEFWFSAVKWVGVAYCIPGYAPPSLQGHYRHSRWHANRQASPVPKHLPTLLPGGCHEPEGVSVFLGVPAPVHRANTAPVPSIRDVGRYVCHNRFRGDVCLRRCGRSGHPLSEREESALARSYLRWSTARTFRVIGTVSSPSMTGSLPHLDVHTILPGTPGSASDRSFWPVHVRSAAPVVARSAQIQMSFLAVRSPP